MSTVGSVGSYVTSEYSQVVSLMAATKTTSNTRYSSESRFGWHVLNATGVASMADDVAHRFYRVDGVEKVYLDRRPDGMVF